MTIIKEYSGGLRNYFLDFNDFEIFRKMTGSQFLAETICCYLKGNNTHVVIDETYDPQSGFKGFHFVIDNVDLSGNGFCFTKDRLVNHLAFKIKELSNQK